MAELDRPGGSPAVPDDWTYAPAPESRDIVSLQPEYGLYIGGRWLEPTETYATIAPRDEETLAQAHDVARLGRGRICPVLRNGCAVPGAVELSQA